MSATWKPSSWGCWKPFSRTPEIAELTQGEYYYAGSAEDLKKVYQTLSSRLVFVTRETEITALFSAAAAFLALIAGLLSVWWFNRIL